MNKEELGPSIHDGIGNDAHPRDEKEEPVASSVSYVDKDEVTAICRVCQCAESDKKGDAILGFLGIIPPPLKGALKNSAGGQSESKDVVRPEMPELVKGSCGGESRVVELDSHNGEAFVRGTKAEKDLFHRQQLVELGCSCKSDLSLVHYSCALKWFVNHGSTICEVCACVAENVRPADVQKVVILLNDHALLSERTAVGDPNPAQVLRAGSSVDPDAVAAIRRQRLCEISSWFGSHANYSCYNPALGAQVVSEQPLNAVGESSAYSENPFVKWALEATGILLASGLLTITLTWIIAPHVGKKMSDIGLHVLIGGICALSIVIFFRIVVLTRIRYGSARYWAVLFVFWFLVFTIWTSTSHTAHPA